MPAEPYIAYVVSHTHWDREWYRTFQVFRMRLVDLTDALLELLETDPGYRHFYWDGQTVVIEDYLEVRPENADRLRRHFRSGALVTGPWFIQPDEFLVSGESFVRNLFAGRRMCEEWGTGASVGYAPDAFGHISQLPQILQGFGIDNAVLFRGITTDQVASEFRWAAPDGTSVLCVKMPDHRAYSNFFYRLRETLADEDRGIPLDEERVVREATELLEDCIAERPTTSNLLWMDGVDHIYAQPRTPRIIEVVNRRLGDRVAARHAALPMFLDAMRAAAPDLETVTGELRISNRAWNLQALLTHVASSRIHLKQWNARCEDLLERWAEPWSAVAWRLGRPYPDHFLRQAWKLLMLNQPHDSICGCSIDQVHREMEPRFEQCAQIGEVLAADAMAHVAARIDTSAGAAEGAVASLVVFNPLGWARRDPLDAVVDLPAVGAPVSIAIAGGDGAPIPSEIEPLPDYHTLTQAPHDIPVGQHRRRWRVRFVAEAPAFGCATYSVIPGGQRVAGDGLACGPNWVRNQHLRVEAAPDGALTIEELATGRRYEGCMVFENGGDFGDGYNYVRPQNDRVLLSTGAEESEVSADIAGPSAVLRVAMRWRVPARREGDGRSVETAALLVDATIRLAREARRVEFEIEVHNTARDHRLRVLFPSGCGGAIAYQAEQAYDVVTRPIKVPECVGWREPQPATAPQKAFADVSDGSRGLCVMNRGLPEVEVVDDSARTVAVTLLRATGNGVGAPDGQQQGQMQGEWRFDLAVMPHEGDWLASEAWREAHAFASPLRAVTTDMHAGTLSAPVSFLSVAPECMMPTAVKRSEDGEALVMRAVNLGSDAVDAAFGNALGLERCDAARLDETVLEAAPGGRVAGAPTRRVVTVRWTEDGAA
ncbi:MAG TPA: glycoside hydrolase family 38 C-terminal domain-containing protein [Chthonomonadales bacterium]|nr:glycoside hydrolase family 38 C-terminal domain-containing protein [Chthonomonadales bacterium]